MVLVKYFVKRIDYIKQEIQVHNPDNCLLLNPLDIPYMNMPHTPFTSVESEWVNITLFRCPAETVIDYYAKLVPCLGNTDYRIYALESDTTIGDVPAVENCTKMYDVLSLPSINVTTNYLSGSPFSEDTLLFKWSTPNCSDCEAKGQKCRLQNNSTQSKIECVPLRKPSKGSIYLYISCFT
jgi:hypothetical protein